MRQYVLRRLALAVPTLVLVSVIVFSIMRLMPGDVVIRMVEGHAYAPTVEALASEYKGRLKVGKMNVDDHQQVPQKYGIRSIPTLLVFKGGQVVGQVVGAVPRSKLEDEVKKHL